VALQDTADDGPALFLGRARLPAADVHQLEIDK
jgi:hypothetical protein